MGQLLRLLSHGDIVVNGAPPVARAAFIVGAVLSHGRPGSVLAADASSLGLDKFYQSLHGEVWSENTM